MMAHFHDLHLWFFIYLLHNLSLFHQYFLSVDDVDLSLLRSVYAATAEVVHFLHLFLHRVEGTDACRLVFLTDYIDDEGLCLR